MLIFIDWISTPDHANFNRAFFSAVDIKDSLCCVFSEKLVIDEVKCQQFKSKNTRISRALSVLHLCWKYRNEHIIFLTYDPVFLPLVIFTKTRFLVFEHNTTPETTRLTKHSIWQQLFFRNILRMAQFRGQFEVLKELKQSTVFVGSPILSINVETINIDRSEGYYIAPSYRASLKHLKSAAQFIQGSRVVVKKVVYDMEDNLNFNGITIVPVRHINLESDHKNMLGAIITLDSRVRGTGWFNDAIKYRIPIITTNDNASYIFSEIFPNYPFIDLNKINSQSDFDKKVREALNFNPAEYVKNHNFDFKQKFIFCCQSVGWYKP